MGIALQIAVPTVALALDAPTRFGFQMYSGMADHISVRATDTAGATVHIDLDTVAAYPRQEIDWTQHLPEYLCAAHPGYVSVTVSRDSGHRSASC